jgi:hypothetical protein
MRVARVTVATSSLPPAGCAVVLILSALAFVVSLLQNNKKQI